MFSYGSKSPIFLLRESEPFDVVKDAVSVLDGSLYLIHVILLICLDVGYLLPNFLVVNWAVAWYKQFNFRDVDCRVGSPLVGEH